ncbi:hypothetical protein Calhy_0778 [Caldicellulosiruptor hydrothermalis 108]|uniref:Uncharacterized protein n=1 Tax=Caldicellulosiruptor hydrothermalis (strain DSM 18901 / VKM B-2411 / 108) TaxID=632292 RepID=E4QE21_CALH1|nr:hypothetical protein [Caldicellulosiruptor hydrothermalis]ADQ06515.1 hypothetical protein Calhy_0778 [Caldicellulosiruptor hydrothermalis 108]
MSDNKNYKHQEQAKQNITPNKSKPVGEIFKHGYGTKDNSYLLDLASKVKLPPKKQNTDTNKKEGKN